MKIGTSMLFPVIPAVVLAPARSAVAIKAFFHEPKTPSDGISRDPATKGLEICSRWPSTELLRLATPHFFQEIEVLVIRQLSAKETGGAQVGGL